MSFVRDAAYSVGLAVSSPFWGFSLLRTGKWRTDWKGRFGHPGQALPGAAREGDRPTILLNAVSVGEVNAIRLLVKELAESARVIIGVTTDTGFARAKQVFEPDHEVVRYPFDFTRSVKRFLDRIKPDVVAQVELEVWPNFIDQCTRRGIPVCVVNGRLSARSFKGYLRFRPLLRSTFAKISAAAVQTQDYAERFTAMGVPNDRVMVSDSMKWDTAQVADFRDVPGTGELANAFGIDRSRPVIVAGSTGPDEEQLLIDTCPPDVQLVLVPRKPERFNEVAFLAPNIVRRTKHSDDSPRQVDGTTRLYLLDTMGELRKAYAFADVVLVGRSFVGLYGSDPIEPVALGKPTIIGTHHSDFADIVKAFADAGGIEVSDEPGRLAAELLADPDRAGQLAEHGRNVILSRQGATKRTAEMIMKLLSLTAPTAER